MSSESSNLTSQLNAARAGDRAAAEQALGQVYAELKRMAGGILRGNSLTVDATSLVHDAFLRLIPESERQFADRRHFFRLAARAHVFQVLQWRHLKYRWPFAWVAWSCDLLLLLLKVQGLHILFRQYR